MPKPLKTSDEAQETPVTPGHVTDGLEDDTTFEPLNFLSKEESGKGDYAPLQSNIYDITLESATVATQAQYGKTDGSTEKVIKATFVIEGRADGKPITDVDGKTFDPGFRKMWDTFSLRSTGFKQGGGEPGKTRAAICALTGNDPEKPFKLGSLEEIIGKSCKAFVTLVPKKDGTGKKNKIDKYMTT